MRLGTMTSLFRERGSGIPDIDYDEAIIRCAKAGYQVLDFSMCSLNRRKTHLHEDDWEKQVSHFIETANEYGVVFPQTHLPYRNATNTFISEEEKQFFESMEMRALRISKMVGAGWAVVHPICKDTDMMDEKNNLELNRRVFSSLRNEAEKLGIGLAFENMINRQYCIHSDELTALADAMDSGICWDFGHGLLYYGPEQTTPLMQCGKRIKALHVHDNYGSWDMHLMPGMGINNWPSHIEALEKIGYQGDFILEIRTNEFMPDSLKDETAAYTYRIGTAILNSNR